MKSSLVILVTLAVGGLAGSAKGEITGHWSFEAQDLFLSAKIGQPMLELDLDTSINEMFGTTGEAAFASVPKIGGQAVPVLKFPKTGATGGYYLPPNAQPNGGGANINQYTLLLDILFPSSSSGKARALFQTDAGGDAEFFVNAANQVGISGGPFAGNLTPDAWHRVVFAVDLAATPPAIAYFIDGLQVFSGDPGSGLDGRLSIPVPFGSYSYLLFASDDSGETEEGYVSNLQFRDDRIPDAVVTALGGPTAGGIPTGPLADPYLISATPSPESARIPQRSTVSPQPVIRAVIVDGTNAVDTSKVTVLLNGLPLVASTTKADGTNTISAATTGFLPALSTNTVRIDYQGADGTPYTTQWQFVVGAYQALAASAAGPLGSAVDPGFLVRSVQAPSTSVILNLNSLPRAIQQLNGTLTDTGGVAVANVAFAGQNPDGGYNANRIDYHLDGTEYGVFQTDATFPGIPGSDGGFDNFSTEVLTYLELSAGVHRLGVSVSTDRTDTETDDGYALFAGVDARNVLSPVVGSFFRGNVPAFAAAFTTNDFNIVAPSDGIYSFRLVFFQTRNDASLEFYAVDPDSGDRILVNDAGDGRAVKAYRHSMAPLSNKPFLAEINPRPGASGVSALLPIQLLLIDDATQVDLDSIQLLLNGAVVPATSTKVNGRTTISYQPNATRNDPTNQFHLVYRDNSLPTPISYTNDWAFTIAVNTSGESSVAGQWDFDYCDLSATIGNALQYFDGPNGSTAAKTQFGTCSQLGVALINGEDARIMRVPGDLDRNIGYIMDHGIAPNGGGTKVNQYTLIMDIMVDSAGPAAASLLQINSLNNSDDGDLFWQGNNFGQGGGGYNGTGAFTPLVWHRICAAYDEAANPPVVTKYVDGIKQDDWTANQGLDALRRALLPTAILFGDGDQDERRVMWVNSIQIRAGKLSDAQMAALGGPSGSGVPVVIPENDVTGQWDFDQGNLAATIGKPLAYFDGPAGLTASGTQFGTCSSLGVSLINNEDAMILRVPGDLDRNIGYIMDHGIAPNGGGTKVNQYTLIMDIMVDSAGPGAASLLQINSLNNSDAGDLFWQGNNFGQGGGGYNGTGAFTPLVWHRISAAFDEAANPPVVTKYVDGIKQDDWTANQGLDALRRALLPTAILFGDGDQDERRVMWVNSIQIRAGALSKAEMAALGGPSAGGIPVVISLPAPAPAAMLSFNRSGNTLRLTWPAGVTGFTLQSSPSLSSPDWRGVANVGNCASVNLGPNPHVFRLIKPSH